MLLLATITYPLMLRTLLALALAIQPVMAADLPDLGEVSRQYFSDQEEQAMGRAIMRDVYADPRYLDDPEIETYLNQLGYKLVSVSTRNQREFNFFVVNDPSINAFAMPGGNIGVHTGLLLSAQGESELASVVAHEIAHVTQDHIARMVASQSQSYWPTMAALALALLASRSNPNVASAAIASTQAYSIQNQLNYSRDYEREADRLGYEMLTRGGYDPRGMSGFFDRLQRANRFYDSSAPAYLRTHPLTSDRIADMQARSEDAPYQQVEDSLDFQLVRARLRAQEDSPADAVLAARNVLKEKRYSNETAARYGLATALLRARQFKEAETEVQKLLSGKPVHPMIQQLAARSRAGRRPSGARPAALPGRQRDPSRLPPLAIWLYRCVAVSRSQQRCADTGRQTTCAVSARPPPVATGRPDPCPAGTPPAQPSRPGRSGRIERQSDCRHRADQSRHQGGRRQLPRNIGGRSAATRMAGRRKIAAQELAPRCTIPYRGRLVGIYPAF